jgi:hypothetical protein
MQRLILDVCFKLITQLFITNSNDVDVRVRFRRIWKSEGQLVDKSIKFSCQPEVRRRNSPTNYVLLPNVHLKFLVLNSSAKEIAARPFICNPEEECA